MDVPDAVVATSIVGPELDGEIDRSGPELPKCDDRMQLGQLELEVRMIAAQLGGAGGTRTLSADPDPAGLQPDQRRELGVGRTDAADDLDRPVAPGSRPRA
jgi:hypothetical protein